MKLEEFKKIFTIKFNISLLIIWQFFSVLAVGIGEWPSVVIWINFTISIVFILFTEPYYALLYIVSSLPFSVALPLPKYDSIPLWRLQFALLFGIWFLKKIWTEKKLAMGNIYNSAFEWDSYLGLFALTGIVSVLYARFRLPAAKEVVFLGNIYLVYLLCVNLIKTRQQVIDFIKYCALALTLVVFIGYIQLFATFFTSSGTFWVYWASFISKLYYGHALSNVLMYSNSWFSYSGGGSDLRMFSILPDSHSFAMLSVYCISFLLPLTYLYQEKKIFGYKIKYYLWSTIRFAGLAIVLSGTRAVWVALLVPALLVGLAYYYNYLLPIAKKIFWPLIIIVFFFVLSPFINKGLHYLQVSKFEENFLQRAASIYNLNEESNQGRLMIWKSSAIYAFKHPLGTGIANFIVSLSPDAASNGNYDQVAEQKNRRYNLPQKFITAHNLYLQVWVELGILGLVTFLLFFGKYFRVIERFVRKTKDENNLFNFFVIEVAIFNIWFLAAGMFDVTFFNDKVLIFFFISLALSSIIIKNYDGWAEGEQD